MFMKSEVLSASVEFIDRTLSHPLQLSSGLITEITEAQATVHVRIDSREAMGVGSIYLSDLWAWPDPTLSHAFRDEQMRALCRNIAENLPQWCQPAAHPLELGLRLHDRVCHGNEALPVLARALCMSPFDAAIHDATGHALHRSAFSFYNGDLALPAVDGYFKGGSACHAIRQCLNPQNELKVSLDAWWIVGAKDALPSALEDPIRRGGYRGFKIKLLAKSVDEDLGRTIAVFEAAKGLGAEPRLSLDSNEGNKDSGEVLEFLERLRAVRPDVFEALEYLEQPTGRDITVHCHDWRKVSELKPIFLDEGLTDLSLLPLAKEQGWSGLALKTCKGHSFTLVAAAWAHEQGIPVAMQDLTNPGYAAIHSYLIAAHLDTINGIELNSPQYTPNANQAWLPRRSDLFLITDGKHRLPLRSLIGLGSDL